VSSPLPGSTLLPPAGAQDESEHDRQRKFFNQRRRDVRIDRNVGELKEYERPRPVRLLLPKCDYYSARALIFNRIAPGGITIVMPLPAPVDAKYRTVIYNLMVERSRWHPLEFDAETKVQGLVYWDFTEPDVSFTRFLKESLMDDEAFNEVVKEIDKAYRVDDFRDLLPDSMPPQTRER
jgi:hypothetical protein